MQHFGERLQMSSHNHRGLYHNFEKRVYCTIEKVLVQYIFLTKYMIPAPVPTMYVLGVKSFLRKLSCI